MPNDSLEKVGKYFHAVASEDFTFMGVDYPRVSLTLTENLFRGYTCPSGCGACCRRYTMDWLPFETRPDNDHIKVREVEANGKKFPVHSFMQREDDTGFRCKFLIPDNGRCGIHTKHAMSCDFELMRFIHRPKTNRMSLTTSIYQRGWAMRRIEGAGVGNMCELIPCTPEIVDDICRRLTRLGNWADYFQIPNVIPKMLEWVEKGPQGDRLVLDKRLEPKWPALKSPATPPRTRGIRSSYGFFLE